MTSSSSSGALAAVIALTASTGGLAGSTGVDGHACAIVNGDAQCWGLNTYGQLGNGSISNALVPQTAPNNQAGAGSAQVISAGADHTCSVANGFAFCWGHNDVGQLGDGTTMDRRSPVQLPSAGLATMVQGIAAGGRHTCAIVAGGVWCWGRNSEGELGLGTTTGSNVPVQNPTLTSGVQAIVAGFEHACALVNGGVWCWGNDGDGQLGFGVDAGSSSATPTVVPGLASGVQAITAGANHTCALSNGSVWCWGSDASGQLGNGATAASVSTPQQVVNLTNATAISAGGDHTCAIVDGAVWCWGGNESGQLGNGSTVGSSIPVHVASVPAGAQAIAAGNGETCAIVNGAVTCWGSDADGQLGDAAAACGSCAAKCSLTSAQVVGLTGGVTGVGAGSAHSCAVVNGGAQCWGDNTYDQLGNQSAGATSSVPIVALPAASGVQAIAGGGSPGAVHAHTCAIQNGLVSCWGSNDLDQLGPNAAGLSSATPVPISGTSGATALALGEAHSCALVNGGVLCWGSNGAGQLGDPAAGGGSGALFTPIGLGKGVQAIAGGGQHTCAIMNGAAWCWGDDTEGDVGNGATVTQATPTMVIGSGVQAIAAGTSHSCAVVNGLVWCWGANDRGQLGIGSPPLSVSTPHMLGLTSAAMTIAAGGDTTCAIVVGEPDCWGDDADGQVGPTCMASSCPNPNGIAVFARALAIGGAHACALIQSNVACWGGNMSGQLGRGSAVPDDPMSAPVAAWAP
jgi:alpha-tubulin suppressor-like RCC1 family protein